MENLLWLIPALACPLMMVAMMLAMGMGMRSGPKDEGPKESSVEELLAEQRRLAEQIERLKGTEPGTETREPARTGAQPQ